MYKPCHLLRRGVPQIAAIGNEERAGGIPVTNDFGFQIRSVISARCLNGLSCVLSPFSLKYSRLCITAVSCSCALSSRSFLECSTCEVQC